MFHRVNIHGLGLMLAEWVGLGASVEAIVRFLHGPHAVAVANFLAAFAVAAYTHSVRDKAAKATSPAIDVDELARLLRAELRPRLHEPERPATVPFVSQLEPFARPRVAPTICDTPGCRWTYWDKACPGCGKRPAPKPKPIPEEPA